MLFDGLREALLAEPAVDVLITRDGAGAQVETRRGRAWLGEHEDGTLDYRVAGDDPFGLAALPKRLDPAAALEATFDSGYPDVLVQVAQLLRSPRAGDVIVTARPGYDLRERFEWPEHRSGHGALHPAHMLTPLAVSAPLADEPMRTADVAPTVLDWLEAAPLPTADGRSRLALPVRPL
jgi:hypothetical protein